MDDPRTITQNELDLHNRIMNEIVDPEVIQQMDRVGWEEAGIEIEQPAADNPTQATEPANHQPTATTPDNPAPAVAATPETAPATVTGVDWESLREPSGLILGKYKTEAEAVKGVGHAVAMAKQAFTERDQLQQRVRELETRTTLPAPPQTVSTPEPVIPESSILDAAFDEIVQEGGLLDEKSGAKLRQAIREEARKIAKEITAEVDTRKRQDEDAWAEVGSYMSQNHPDSVNFTAELNVFVASNPVIQKTVADLLKEGNRIGATEYAWLRYNAARDAQATVITNAEAQKREIQLDAADQVRREAVEVARRDAGVVTTTASGVHEAPNAGPTQDEVELAAAEMRRTTDGSRWRALVFGPQLRGPMFD